MTPSPRGDAWSAQLRERLRHTFWIGGGSGGGKSTVARQLGAQHGLSTYATDDVMAEHGRRIDPGDAPFLSGFMSMTADERWVTRSPDLMLETFHWYRGEGFELIVEDLLALPADARVIVEGFRLLPKLVSRLLASPTQAVWLLPTPELRRLAFDARRPAGAPWSFVDGTGDPARALENLVERDRLFTEQLAVEAAELELHAIRVDVAMSTDDVAALVADWFGLR